MSLHPVIRRGIAGVGLVSLLAGSSLIAGPASGASGSEEPTRTTTSIAASMPKADPGYQMPKIPVWVKLGSRGLGGVTVSVRDANGDTRISARTNPSGVVLIPRTFLRGDHSLTVTGGAAWRRLGKPTLSTGELIGTRNAVILISPVTSIAHRVAERMGTSYVAALKRTRKAHGIPSYVDHVHAAATDRVFHTGKLRKWSKRHGGLSAGMDHLAKRIATGKPVPSFKPDDRQQTRDSVEEEGYAWVGKAIMSGILTESGSYGAEMALGNIFGFSDPDATALSDINQDLHTIISELNTIETELQELDYLMEETSYQVLASGMADLAGAVNGNDTGTGLWTVYESATTLDWNSTTYEQDIAGFATAFYNGIYGILPSEVGELFDSPTSQGLLHQLYSFNTAPWWNSNDVESISATIDYYGTLQAQAVGLLNEAWSYNGPGANPAIALDDTDINIFNTDTYGPQNADIYLSAPTQLDDTEIGVPSSQMVYAAFPLAVDHVYEQRSGDYYPLLPTCSDNGEALTKTLAWPPIESSTSAWQTTWQSAMPSGWASQSGSVLGSLNESRMLPNSSGTDVATTPLPTLAANTPDAYLLAANGLLPGAGYNAVADGHPEPILQQWMWCQDSAVSLVNTSKWVTNFVMGIDGTNVPSTAPSDWALQAIPVGVLGGQPGSFRYVEPPASN